MATQFDRETPAGMVGRIKNLILEPRAEWQRIDGEVMTPRALLTGWAVPLAAIGPVAQLIGSQLFGYGALGFHYRPSIGSAIVTAVLSYVFSLVAVWLLALVIDGLAPSFGGTKSTVQAMKVAVYSATASWVVAVVQLLPSLFFIGLLGLYSLYLLYLGLPMLMKSPADKAMSYTIVTVVVAAVLFVIASMLAGTVTRAFVPTHPIGTISGSVSVPGVGKVDLGKLDQAAKQMEAATSAAQATPAGGTTAPASLAGWTRTEIESTGGNAAGIGGSTAQATYQSGDNQFTLSVTDSGALGSIATLGGALTAQSSKQTATGYEKTELVDGRMVSEKWDSSAHSGSYGTMVASRFMVSADGSAPSIDTLKGAVAAVDLGKLQALAK